MKHTRSLLLLALLPLSAALLLCACDREPEPPVTDTSEPPSTSGGETAPNTPEETTAKPATEPSPEPAVSEIVILKPDQRRSSYRIMYDKDVTSNAELDMIAAVFNTYTGAGIQKAEATKSADKEIVYNSEVREETRLMKAALSEGEYAIRAGMDGDGDGTLYVAATTYRAGYAAMEYLMETYYTAENGLCVPSDLDVNGTEKEYTMITADINQLRDPCIVVKDGVYYAYGTGWHCYKNTGGNLQASWQDLGVVASVANPDTDGGSHWAPEVHEYKGSYYMFTTYYNSVTTHRGCIILKADSPEGPFVEITNGHITPADWDAIDGTFYVDPDGQPWMVFVHEWTSMPDGNGSFAAAKLSDDLTHFISEPFELFKARDPAWAVAGVTDGCWMYTTREGDLLMVWSNFDALGYTVAVARSSNGRLDGEWIQEGLLYSKYMTNQYDGGHGMIFIDVDGQMYLSFHSPNSATGERKEKPVFLAIEEKGGKLVWAESEAKGD